MFFFSALFHVWKRQTDKSSNQISLLSIGPPALWVIYQMDVLNKYYSFGNRSIWRVGPEQEPI